MINFIHCVRRFAPALPLRGTSPREDGLHEATDAVLTHHNNQLISTVWASIRNSPRLHLKNRRDLSKVQGQLNSVHPNSTGGLLIRDAVVSMLDVGSSGDINLIKLGTPDELLGNTDLSCEVGAEEVTLHWRQFPGVNYTLKESAGLGDWTSATLPSTRGNAEQSTVLDRSNVHFWKLEASYPLLWK